MFVFLFVVRVSLGLLNVRFVRFELNPYHESSLQHIVASPMCIITLFCSYARSVLTLYIIYSHRCMHIQYGIINRIDMELKANNIREWNEKRRHKCVSLLNVGGVLCGVRVGQGKGTT